MSHLPSTKALNYLVHLHEHRNFGRAAQACHITQSTLSSAVQALEEQLGITLVERTHRQLVFTAMGEAVVARARRVLTETRELVHLAEQAQGLLAGPLNLGCIPTIAPFLLPQVLSSVETEFPELRLAIQEDQTDRLLQALHDGSLDLALLALPYDTGVLAQRVLFRDGFHLAFPRKHAERFRALSEMSELPDNEVLLLEDGHCLRGHAIEACRLSRHASINTLSASSLHTLVHLVNHDLGITFIPQMAVDAGILAGTEVTTEDLGAQGAYREIGLVWRKTAARAEEFAALGELIQRQYASAAGPAASESG